ncbi:MAG: spondin domain-containing protein [Methylomonas sp.]|jgi:hypothetical protein
MKFFPILMLAGALSPVYSAQAEEVTINFANLAGADGVALSPVFIALTNSPSLEYTPGTAASSAIAQLAETGSGAGLMPEFAGISGAQTAEVVATTNNFTPPGIYLPGGTGSITLNLDPVKNEYLSFYTMVVPSNDRFIGGEIQLFNSAGQFIGANAVIDGSAIWDAGAVASQVAGAVFIANDTGSNTPTPNGVITADDNYSVYNNSLTPAGYSFTNLPGDNTPILGITAAVVPEPPMAWLFASVLWLAALARRRMAA